MNIWDVGGQKSLRSYWRNYFEQTDGLVWVVDSADVWRLQDCAEVRFEPYFVLDGLALELLRHICKFEASLSVGGLEGALGNTTLR